MKKIIYTISFILLVFSSIGCSGRVKHMDIVPREKTVISTPPKKGKAKIIFIRPTSMGHFFQSSVFEIKNKKPSIVGIVPAKKKISYEVEPGKHLFMVVSESADFMKAELLADKTYVVFITPRTGWFKSRFSLEPIYRNTRKSKNIAYDLEKYQLLEVSEDTLKWVKKNSPDIQRKYINYYRKWARKDNDAKPFLKAVDFISKKDEFL